MKAILGVLILLIPLAVPMEIAPAAFDPFSYQKTGKPLAVVLTGAGISAESGLKTFRDSNGLWENHNVMDVASIEGWHTNPELVLEFYNQRRKQAFDAQPNAGHVGLRALEDQFDVVVVTQNVDDLHEKAGSASVVHLHGQLRLVRSTKNPLAIYDVGPDPIYLGDTCPEGGQLRPHIVWFGEEVPLILPSAYLAAQADVFVVIGTSLNVYPAAGLVDEAPPTAPKFLVDPKAPSWLQEPNLTVIQAPASSGVPELVSRLTAPDFLANLGAA